MKRVLSTEQKVRKREWHRAWRRRNPDKIRGYEAKYRAEHPEKYKSRVRAYYKANAEKRIANARAWSKANKERVRENMRRSNWKAKGIDPTIAEAVLAAHSGTCDCCGTSHPGGRHDAWNIDHEHSTGRIRGVLCNLCNIGIGRLGDTLDGVLKAVRYLQRSVNY